MSLASKAQAHIEAFSIVIIFAAIFFVMSGIYKNELSSTSRRMDVLAMEQVVRDVSLSVNSALLQGDGYSANLSLPYKIGPSGYNVTIAEGVVTVTMDSGLSVAYRTMTKNVTGTFRSGQNQVKNSGGNVYVS